MKSKIERFLLMYKIMAKAKMPSNEKQAYRLLFRTFKMIENTYSKEDQMYFFSLRLYVHAPGLNIFYCLHNSTVVILSKLGEMVLYQNSKPRKKFINIDQLVKNDLINQELYFSKTRRNSVLRKIIEKNSSYIKSVYRSKHFFLAF